MKLSILVVLVTGCTVQAGAQTTTNSGHIDFDRDIRPILSDKCFVCHGPDAANNKSKLRFDTEAHAFADLGNGRRAIVHGDPKQSQLVRRITAENACAANASRVLRAETQPAGN